MKTPAHKKRLKAAIAQQIRHLTRCLKLVACVDLEIYALGRNIFSHDAALAQWLTEPAPALRGAIPLVGRQLQSWFAPYRGKHRFKKYE